jgi:3-hydroxyisobutyrate dehydrogenase-like beta-hydroxyacid dehydrogenase
LVAAGAEVFGFDPKVPAPEGVWQGRDETDAVREADLVLSLTTAEHAEAAVLAALPAVQRGTVWAEANTAGPSLKQRLADQLDLSGVGLVDVAIMAPVPPTGLRTPMLASGPAAELFAGVMADLGVSIDVVDGPVGAASSRKLLRSVVYKGLAAAVTEATAAAGAAGCAAWFEEYLTIEFAGRRCGRNRRM